MRNNPLTSTEKKEIKDLANLQYAISRKYTGERSAFWYGRSVGMGKIAQTYNPGHWLKTYAKKHGGTYTRKVEPSGMIVHTVKFPNGILKKNPLLETIGAGIVTGLGLGTGFAVAHRVADKVLGKRNPVKPHTEVVVSKLPKCDFCSATAQYDGKTRMGPWANMCPMHFRTYGVGLGLGRGQKLILKKNPEKKLSSYERYIRSLAEKRKREKEETIKTLKRIRKLPIPNKKNPRESLLAPLTKKFSGRIFDLYDVWKYRESATRQQLLLKRQGYRTRLFMVSDGWAVYYRR